MNFDTKTLEENLNYLKLKSILKNYQSATADAAAKNLTHLELLGELISQEAAEHFDRSVNRRLRQANLPYLKTIDQFQWSHPTKINQQQIKHLFMLTFTAEKANPIFIAPPGLGKTHLAIALAHQACHKAHTVLFTTAAEMILKLKAAYHTNQLIQALKKYTHPTLLIIDQLGYSSLDEQACDLFFQVISDRYEHASTILTTNKAFKDWCSIFNGNYVVTSAILDRLLHHCEVVIIEGESYRIKGTIQYYL